ENRHCNVGHNQVGTIYLYFGECFKTVAHSLHLVARSRQHIDVEPASAIIVFNYENAQSSHRKYRRELVKKMGGTCVVSKRWWASPARSVKTKRSPAQTPLSIGTTPFCHILCR